LVLAWSFYHKLYEPESKLSRNFLVITPNIIVLDRIKKDFEGLHIFFDDPVIPDNGVAVATGMTIFNLLCICRTKCTSFAPPATSSSPISTASTLATTSLHLLTTKIRWITSWANDQLGATTDSKVDLGMIVRDIDELMILNDEAHHIHDPRMAWFKSINDIHNRLKLKDSSFPCK